MLSAAYTGRLHEAICKSCISVDGCHANVTTGGNGDISYESKATLTFAQQEQAIEIVIAEMKLTQSTRQDQKLAPLE